MSQNFAGYYLKNSYHNYTTQEKKRIKASDSNIKASTFWTNFRLFLDFLVLFSDLKKKLKMLFLEKKIGKSLHFLQFSFFFDHFLLSLL